jgi:hypothetical protein
MNLSIPGHPLPHWARRALVVYVPLLVIAAAAVVAVLLSTDKAVAHPENGQPCQCHGATAAPTVAVKASKARIAPRKKATLTGSVAPGFPGLKAQMQVKKGAGVWKVYKTLILSPQSTVATTWKTAVKGTYRFRLNYLGDNQYAPGASAPVTVKVR